MISVIIPAHNEQDYIVTLLTCLNNQELDKKLFEVIVVDNASKDSTIQRVWDYSKSNKSLNVRLVHEQERGVSRARNTGARYAKYDNFLFLDADNTVEVNFLTSILEIQRESEISVATIKTMPDRYELKYLTLFSLLEFFKISRLRPFGKSFIRRQVFCKINGFNESISLGENVEMLVRAKQFALSHKINFQHIRRVSIKCSLRRFDRSGFFPVVIPWFIAYLGVKNLSYKAIGQLTK